MNNLGWCSSNGMGLQAISFTEIKSYIEITEASLTGEEALLLHKMSQAYVKYLSDKNPQTQSPFQK